jgi:glycosyltransferase involved in cell wall biosynthesis
MRRFMARQRLTTACLINHFNYGGFVGEAIQSALKQTVAFDEIVVVDDGSRADELAKLREACKADPRIALIEKANGGQLSCFHEGFARCTADIVFFLDADDFWDPGYVEAALAIYERRKDVGFVAASHRVRFSDGTKKDCAEDERDLGYSIVRCHRHPHWVGAPTSCVSMRRSVLAQFLPFDSRFGWRTCADECLVVGASLVGARKHSLGSVHVNYRVHGDNAWHGRRYDAADRLFRRLEGLRLCQTLREKLSLPDELASLAADEFRTIERPSRRDYRHYCRVVQDSRLSLGAKLRARADLLSTYWFGRKRGKI